MRCQLRYLATKLAASRLLVSTSITIVPSVIICPDSMGKRPQARLHSATVDAMRRVARGEPASAAASTSGQEYAALQQKVSRVSILHSVPLCTAAISGSDDSISVSASHIGQ